RGDRRQRRRITGGRAPRHVDLERAIERLPRRGSPLETKPPRAKADRAAAPRADPPGRGAVDQRDTRLTGAIHELERRGVAARVEREERGLVEPELPVARDERSRRQPRTLRRQRHVGARERRLAEADRLE